MIVQTDFVLGSHHVCLTISLVHIIASLCIEFLAHDRCDNKTIYTLCLIADFLVKTAILGGFIPMIGYAFGKCHTGRMNIF